MRAAIALAFVISWPFVTSYAQQPLVGTYKGEYWERGAYVHPHIQTATLRILSTENGKVTGKLELGEDSCRGTYDLAGTYEGDRLSLQTSEGPMVGCAQRITLTGKGNKLVGSFSAESPGRPGIELIRQ